MRYEPVYMQYVFLEHPLLYISIFIIGLLLYKLINRRKDKPSGSSTPPSAPATEKDYDTAVAAAMKEKGRSTRVVEFIDDEPIIKPGLRACVVIFVESVDRQTHTIYGTSLGMSYERIREYNASLSVFKPDGHHRLRKKRVSEPDGEYDISITVDNAADVQIGDVLATISPDANHTITCERVASWKYRVHYTLTVKREKDAEPAANDKENVQATPPEAHASLTEKLIPAHDAESASVRLDRALTALHATPTDQSFQNLVCAMVKEGLDERSLYLPTGADHAPLHFEFNQTRVYALYTDQTMAQACADACAGDGAAASCIRLPLGQVIETANGSAAIALDLGLPTQAILPPDVVHTIQHLKMMEELEAEEPDDSWTPWTAIWKRYFEKTYEEDMDLFLAGDIIQRADTLLYLPVQLKESDSRTIYQLVPERFGFQRI